MFLGYFFMFPDRFGTVLGDFCTFPINNRSKISGTNTLPTDRVALP